MPAYVPPALRNKTAAAAASGGDEAPPSRFSDRGERPERSERTERPPAPVSNSRFDSLRDDAPPQRSFKGGKGSKGGGKSSEDRFSRDDREPREQREPREPREPREQREPRGKGEFRKGYGRERDNEDGGWDDEQEPQESRPTHGGRSGGKGGRQTVSELSGAGGDWRNRQDGRRGYVEDKPEVEVFGEARTRSSAGIEFDKYDAIPVDITGRDIENIKPIQKFSDAKLVDSLFDNLRRCGYDRPTPVQRHSIPIVVGGRDLMACAQTGSGKTCGFMVPCLESLLRTGPPPPPYHGTKRPRPMPCALVLAPTRELAAQIYGEACKFSWSTGIRCCIIYGGVDMQEQKRDMEKGCDILIATPGRLIDVVDRGHVSLELIQFFILDEADRMLDMGFEPNVRQIVTQTNMGASSQFVRQSMMFSATFANEVQLMAKDFLNDYVFITIGRVGSASELIKQYVEYAEDIPSKRKKLEHSIQKHRPADGLAVVFVETKKTANELELYLYNAGVQVTAIHGDRVQAEREEALACFKSGANPVLVATNVAARGLDIPNVALVVNFDMPHDIDDYVHRIGRTGRAGRKGVAIAFVNERCPYLHELGNLLSEANQEIPSWFGELCRNARPRGKGKGKGDSRFGGQDIRMEGDASGITAIADTARNNKSASWNTQPTRGPNDFGATGADDAW
mmetsp:Transcript_56505/g.123553  ORF Transcript_56505/g.123553 Transcript_56505/m.123553 type:complete len:681 (-) Transcript_56505:113-2155(-)